MNVLTIYYRNYGGGCFKRLLLYINALLQAGHTVHYISMNRFPIKHPQLFFHHIRIPFNNQYIIAFIFLFYVPFYSLHVAIKQKIHLMSVFDWPYVLIFSFVKYFCTIPILLFQRIDWIQQIKATRTLPIAFICQWMIKQSIFISDKICSVGEGIFKNLLHRYNLSPDKGVIITNNLPRFKKEHTLNKKTLQKMFTIPENSFVIGYAGTLTKRKNINILIKALRSLQDVNAVLLIIGQGKEKKTLQLLSKKLHVYEKIYWKDWVHNILPIISGIDLMVLPSDFEGCPNALLEALAVETLCIASDVVGSSEVLHYPELLFPLNKLELLTKIIERIIVDKDYNKKLSLLCSKRKKYYDFNWNKEVVSLSVKLANSYAQRKP